MTEHKLTQYNIAEPKASPRSFTLGDRIDQAVSESAQRLQAAKRAREILDKNPEIEELVNLLGRF